MQLTSTDASGSRERGADQRICGPADLGSDRILFMAQKADYLPRRRWRLGKTAKPLLAAQQLGLDFVRSWRFAALVFIRSGALKDLS